MASEAGEPAPGERKNEPHVSFVQRLQRHFTAEVDPRIDLQDEEEKAAKPLDESSRTSTSVEDFVRRLSPSVEVGSRYEIKEEVAAGGMGTILRVWDGDLRRNLAMKVMHGRGSGSTPIQEGSGSAPVDPERLGRFLEEAQITGQLDHPGVVPVHDLGIDSKGRCYFTMRFVRGRELKEVLDLAREGKDNWTRTKVLGVILKVCEAMAYAHSKGVVHRDLKPANIMVGRFGETYLMDWGLARVLGRRDSHDLRLRPRAEDASALSLVRTVRRDETELNPDSPLVTMDGDVIGTPSYMAPEQARGKLEEVGPRSDVYSLGAILYYMHTGQAPYVKPGERLSPHTVLSRVLDAPPTPVEQLAPNEPPELIAICTKAMARDPEQRYGSMLEVADDIQAFLENRVVRAYERGSLAEFKKWVVRNQGMAAGIAGMLTLALASGIFFFVQQRQENEALRKSGDETKLAKEDAERNLGRAQESEREAQKNLELANEGRKEADKQTGIARVNEVRALRSGYAANILAADYSLKLNEIAEARTRLRETNDGLRGWEWKHLNLLANGTLADLGRITAGVEALAFHPTAERVIMLTGQGHLELRDIATGDDVPPDKISASETWTDTLLQIFSNLSFDVNADGTRIALAGATQGLQVFDLETGERPPGVPSTGLAGHGAKPSAVAFSPNGRLLASGDDDGQIVVRDALNWELRQHFTGHIGPITGLAWSPGSERLASSSRDGSVRLWEMESGRDGRTLRGHRGAVRGVAWDLSGEHVFSCGEDGAVNEWEVENGRLVRSFLGHTGAVLSLDYDPNRERLVTGSADRTVRLWDVSTGECAVLRGHEFGVKEVAFDPSGERILSGDQNGIVYLWDAVSDPATTELRLHRGAVSSLAFDPSGKRLVTASRDFDLLLWDAETGEPLRRLHKHASQVNSVVFSADGRTLLSGSHDKLVFLWDAETGQFLRTFGPFDRWVQSALLTPDGTRVIVATGDKKVRVLDAQTTEVLHDLSGYAYPADAIALSPDGNFLATVGKDFVLWDLKGSLEQPVFTKKGKNTSVAYSPDGKRIATGSSLGLLQLWDARTGEWLVDQKDQTKRINAIVYSPDGKRLVSASDDGEIRVREAQTGETLLVLRDPDGAVQTLAFSPDGTRLAAGAIDGGVRIYETSPVNTRRALRRESLAVREQARERVEALFASLFRRDDVLRELNSDTSLSQALRESALRQVYLRGDDPLPLLQLSLEECLDFERTRDEYDLALERASAAQSMKANAPAMQGNQLDGLIDLVMGAASYRTARYADAKQYLDHEAATDQDEPRAMHAMFGRRERAVRLLFLCMTQCQTNDGKTAERTWRQAQQVVLDDVELSQRADLGGLLAEVETLVRSSVPAGS